MFKILYLAGLSVFLCACTSGSGTGESPDGSAIDAGSSGEAGTNDDASGMDAADADVTDAVESYKLLVLDPFQCTGFPLPTSNGLVDCRIIVDSADGGCVAPGLVTAPMGDVAAINSLRQAEGAPILPGSVCVLDQLMGSSPGLGCSEQQAIGWCYVLGSCVSDSGVACAQDVCATMAVLANTAISDVAYLACP